MQDPSGNRSAAEIHELSEHELRQILAEREEQTAASLAEAANELERRGCIGECAGHPGKPGVTFCQVCFAPACALCCFPGPADLLMCPACFGELDRKEGAVPAESTEGPASAASPPSPDPAVAGLKCSVHPDNDAVHACRTCGARVCRTCDFHICDAVHLCPACASRPQTALSGARKRRLVWSFALAAVATVIYLSMILYFGVSEVSDEQAEVLAGLMIYSVLISGVAGFALGMGAREKHLHNPGALKVAIAWNAVVLFFTILLVVVGIFMP